MTSGLFEDVSDSVGKEVENNLGLLNNFDFTCICYTIQCLLRILYKQ